MTQSLIKRIKDTIWEPEVATKEETSQALSLHSSSELGPALIEMSNEQIRRENAERVQAFVRGTMQHITNLKYDIDRATKQLFFQEQRLNAINAGEFRLRPDFTVEFNDKDLNQ